MQGVILIGVWSALAVGVWLLIVPGRRSAGWSLIGGAVAFVLVSFVVAAQPIPRWVADAGSDAIRDWYEVFHDERWVALVAFAHPVPIVALVAVAWRKGRRWALVLLGGAVAPLLVALVAVVTYSEPGDPGSVWAAAGGFLVGSVVYVVSLVVAVPAAALGPLPPLPEPGGAVSHRGRSPWWWIGIAGVVLVGIVGIVGIAALVRGVGVPSGSTYVEYSGSMGRVQVRGVDAGGGVWVTVYPYRDDPPGSYPELGRYADGAWQTWSVPDLFVDVTGVEAVGFGTDGSVLVALHGRGYVGAGVAAFRHGAWTRYDTSQGLRSDRVMGFVTLEDGCVWALGGGISRFCDGSWEPVAGPPIPYVTQLAAAGDGSVWAIGYRPTGTSGSEYRVAQAVEGEWVDHEELRSPGVFAASLVIGSTGDVWVWQRSVQEPDGVYAWFDGDAWSHTVAPDEPPAAYEAAVREQSATTDTATGPDGVRWESGRNGIYRAERAPDQALGPPFVATTVTPATTTTSQPIPTTTATTTSTTDTPVTTTTRPPYHVGMDGTVVPREPDPGEPFGSGCSPASETLPDGVWFGWIEEYRSDDVAFDLGCLYSTGDGVAVENASARLRFPPVGGDTVVWSLQPEPGGWLERRYAEWTGPSAACPTGEPPYDDGCFWILYVNDGVVTEMLEAAFG